MITKSLQTKITTQKNIHRNSKCQSDLVYSFIKKKHIQVNNKFTAQGPGHGYGFTL